MSTELTLDKSIPRAQESTVVLAFIYIMNATREFWNATTGWISSLLHGFSKSDDRLGLIEFNEDDNDNWSEDGFYELFQNEELFNQTYGHQDNPMNQRKVM